MDGDLLSATFVELTDTMVAGFDVIDFLHVLTDRSVQLLDVSAAGLLLADPRGELRVVAASSEAARLLELFQLQSDQGPCLDCFRTGRPVAAADLAAAEQRWPRFAPAANLGQRCAAVARSAAATGWPVRKQSRQGPSWFCSWNSSSSRAASLEAATTRSSPRGSASSSPAAETSRS